MYTEYFGLTETPFSIAPNPQYLFMSKRHREALAHLLYGIQADGGFILLTGEVGTGKTTLCRCLLEQVPADVETAFVLNPRVSAEELLATTCDEFGISYPDGASLKTLNDELNSYLLDQHRSARKAVLIIDEAQNLSRGVLEQLRLLTNLETSERKLLQIILLGQPELLETLSQQSLRQFSQRITARYHLEALDRDETRDYIEHRMNIAGGSMKLFSRSAIRTVYQLSQGIPRVINLICDRALLGAYAEDKKSVSVLIVAKAATEVLGSVKKQHRTLPFALAAALLLALAAGAYYLGPGTPPLPAVLSVTDSRPASIDQNQTPVPMRPLAGHGNLDAAYHDLFALWGMAFEDRLRSPCELALDVGLMCMQRQVSLDQLLEINRPAIVSMNGRYLTVSEIRENQISLIAGGFQIEMSRPAFDDRFDGEIRMVWRMPPDYRAPLKVHDRGAAVDWLVVQMAVIEGSAPPLETGFTFSESLEAKVRHFQASVGLKPSGVVDPLTWIHINSVEAISIPTLSLKRRG